MSINAVQIFGERERDVYCRIREERASLYLEKTVSYVSIKNRNASSRHDFFPKQFMESKILTITSARVEIMIASTRLCFLLWRKKKRCEWKNSGRGKIGISQWLRKHDTFLSLKYCTCIERSIRKNTYMSFRSLLEHLWIKLRAIYTGIIVDDTWIGETE